MPEADSASFSARAESILGIRWPARGGHPRLRQIEARLRYAVPILLSAFLACLVGVTVLHLRGQRLEILQAASAELGTFAKLAARAVPESALLDAGASANLSALMPDGGAEAGRQILLVSRAERILAAYPPLPSAINRLDQVLGETEALSTLNERAGVMSLTLAGGEFALAAMHRLPSGVGRVAVLQPIDALTRDWAVRARDQGILIAAAALVIVGVGLAYGLQTRRAYAADRTCEQIRQRLETALGRSGCGLWDWDIARGRIYWSDSMYALLGYQPDAGELGFGAINALVHPDDSDLYGLARGLAANHTQVDHTFRMRGAEGAYVWLRVRAEVVPDAIDGGRHLVGIVVDVSEQRHLAESTAAADLRLRDAVEAISEAFVLWDTSNRLVLCNSKFRHLHALSPEDAQPGGAYAEVMGRGVLPRVRRESQETGAPTARTFEAELVDGRWLQISERRTKDGGYVSVGTDITSLKRHQEHLVASERELIATVKDLKRSRRTLELQTQQLADLAERYLDQKAAAERASQSKSEFLATMSHELRTPLNAIIGFADVMENEILGPLGTPRYGEYCRDIRQSGHYLLTVIDEILDMARLEAHRVRIAPAPMPAAAAVARALKVVAEPARAKGLAIAVDVPDDLDLLADPRAIQQILVNLLHNAVKFTPTGGRIAVRARPAAGHTHLFVEDDGIGIPKTALPQLGRPFTQVETNMTRSYKGAGLGLAIARSLAELHGGRLRIRSEEKVGTAVLVRLPGPTPERLAAYAAASTPALSAPDAQHLAS